MLKYSDLGTINFRLYWSIPEYELLSREVSSPKES